MAKKRNNKSPTKLLIISLEQIENNNLNTVRDVKKTQLISYSTQLHKTEIINQLNSSC
jgi:hypothetical protein